MNACLWGLSKKSCFSLICILVKVTLDACCSELLLVIGLMAVLLCFLPIKWSVIFLYFLLHFINAFFWYMAF